MTSTSPAGYCRRCGTPFGLGAATCATCGLELSVVLAERVPATPVYGAPPAESAAREPSAREQGTEPVVLEPDPSYKPQFAAPPTRRFELPRVELPRVELPRLEVPRGLLSRVRIPGFDPRRTRDIVIGGVLVLALILAGLWTWTYVQNRPVHAALDDAAAAYGSVVDALGSASSLPDVRAAAEVASAAADRLATIQMELAGRDGDLADAALDIVRSEHEVVIAASRLSAVSERKLGAWGSVEGSLSDARDQLDAARETLADVDEDEAALVQDPAKAIDNVRSVVGRAATRVLGTSVTSMVDRLGIARRTEQVRQVAAEAHNAAAVVQAALVGLTGESAAVVSAVGEVLNHLARLEGLDADHLDAWGEVRMPLVSALGVVAETDGVGESFGAEVTRAVDNLDSLVAAGRVAMKRWEQDLERAKRKQARAQRGLASYDEAVQAELTTYQGLRSDLAAFFVAVEQSSEEVDAREVLASAIEGRQAVLDALEELVPPARLEESHAALEDVLREAVRVVRAAAGELDDDYYCGDCDYSESESYQEFSADSEQLAADYAAAESAWRDAVGRLEVRISDKALPKKPVV